MKTRRLNKMLMLFFLMGGVTAMYGQGNQSSVPGDNFSLEGALELFKKSTSPQDFEQLINSPDSKVNNLDLNGDGYTDYIKVIDRNNGNVHAFILQAVISENESQDVAVIELEKTGNGNAVLQITGDADIYGIETIIEPTQEVRINAGTSTMRNIVNVWTWPSVQYIYSPYYTAAWVSPWGWNMQPVWWHSWRPIAYYDYYPYWSSYRPYYSSCYNHRIMYAQHLYQPYRRTSVIVYNHNRGQIEHYRTNQNNYNRSGRDREDHNRSNGYQNGNDYHSDTNGRQRSSSYMNSGSRSSGFDNNQFHYRDYMSIDSQTRTHQSSDRHQSISDFRNQSNFSSQKNNIQRRSFSPRTSSPDFSHGSSRQQFSRPTGGSINMQRSPSLQMNRTHSSGGGTTGGQRSHGRGN